MTKQTDITNNWKERGYTKGQQSRIKIVRKASLLFSKYGYAETSISAIADPLGMTKGAVYAHFPSKPELYTSKACHS